MRSSVGHTVESPNEVLPRRIGGTFHSERMRARVLRNRSRPLKCLVNSATGRQFIGMELQLVSTSPCWFLGILFTFFLQNSYKPRYFVINAFWIELSELSIILWLLLSILCLSSTQNTIIVSCVTFSIKAQIRVALYSPEWGNVKLKKQTEKKSPIKQNRTKQNKIKQQEKE
jgi:hypothetical protein